jgi:uncharacterized protein (TIGR02646 family)
MKYISKTEEPQSFKKWKELQRETRNCDYKSLQNPEKRELHQALVEEQRSICCYCQVRIGLTTSHIEHLKAQCFEPDESLNYQNPLASCQGEGEKPRKPEHCGHKRGTVTLPVTPLDLHCEDSFVYTDNGQILANPNLQCCRNAQETIALLGLGISKLQRMRESAIQGIDVNSLTPEDKQKLIDYYDNLNEAGDYEEFCTAIVYVLKS